MNDVMKLCIGQPGELVNADQKKCLEAIGRRYDAETAARHVELCYKIHHWVDSSVNEKLIFEQLLLNLSNSDILTIS